MVLSTDTNNESHMKKLVNKYIKSGILVFDTFGRSYFTRLTCMLLLDNLQLILGKKETDFKDHDMV